jgi:predicted  nucleic acid-binding Zn-ribbon protein
MDDEADALLSHPLTDYADMAADLDKTRRVLNERMTEGRQEIEDLRAEVARLQGKLTEARSYIITMNMSKYREDHEWFWLNMNGLYAILDDKP